MRIRGSKKLGAHYYNGKHTSRGKRFISKLHKGMECGNVEKAFQEIEAQRAREKNNAR